jgi:signal transduction histidine kinase
VGEEVEISVKDNGPGIPHEQLEHIFERFTRGDAGLTQRVGGTGLGLAISKSLVELHGGSIAAESVPGGGSTFQVRLPTQPAPAGQRETETETETA